jgi:hypothetical protein
MPSRTRVTTTQKIVIVPVQKAFSLFTRRSNNRPIHGLRLKAGPVRNFSRLGPCARGQVRVSQPRKRTARGVWPSGKRTRGSNRALLEPDPTGLPAGSALIVVERGPNAGSRFLLDQPVTSVGRHPRSDIFLDDVTVSRRRPRRRGVAGRHGGLGGRAGGRHRPARLPGS